MVLARSAAEMPVVTLEGQVVKYKDLDPEKARDLLAQAKQLYDHWGTQAPPLASAIVVLNGTTSSINP